MTLDLSDRQVLKLRCAGCGRDYDRVVVFATQNGDAYAVLSAVCHGHGDSEVWVDATFGSWVEPYEDHVTLSCRVTAAGAGAVDAVVASSGRAVHSGRCLSRDEALASPRLPELWSMVDALVTSVPEVEAAVVDSE